jgi:hypothetical protein
VFEKLGDLWGRQIRYGDPPDDPTSLIPSGRMTRAEAISELHELSELIDELEEVTAQHAVEPFDGADPQEWEDQEDQIANLHQAMIRYTQALAVDLGVSVP